MAKYSNLVSKLKNLPPELTPNLQSTEESVFDLTQHLAQKPQGGAAQPATAPAFDEPDKTDTPAATDEPAPEQPQFTEPVNTEGAELIDPNMIAEGLADLTDLARQMLYPSIYEKIMFQPHEKELLQNPQLLKPQAAEMLNTKLGEFNDHVKKIAWELNEKQQYIKHIFKPLAAKIDPNGQFMKYYPLLFVAAIEGKRFKAVSNSSKTQLIIDQQPEKAPEEQPRKPFVQPEEQKQPEAVPANETLDEQIKNMRAEKLNEKPEAIDLTSFEA